MLAWAFTFLSLALLGTFFGLLAAGPLGLLAFLALLGAAGWSVYRHYRSTIGRDRSDRTG
jgi:hypothetical protein